MPVNLVANMTLDQLTKTVTSILGALASEKLLLASLRPSVRMRRGDL